MRARNSLGSHRQLVMNRSLSPCSHLGLALSLLFGCGVKGPGRHVNDTTALLWEETVIRYTIMMTARGQTVARCCLSEQTTQLSQQSKSRQQRRETQVGWICQRKIKLQLRMSPSPLGTQRDFLVSALCVNTPATHRRHHSSSLDATNTRGTSTSVPPCADHTIDAFEATTAHRNPAILQDVRHQFCAPVSNFWILQSRNSFIGADIVKRHSHFPRIVISQHIIDTSPFNLVSNGAIDAIGAIEAIRAIVAIAAIQLRLFRPTPNACCSSSCNCSFLTSICESLNSFFTSFLGLNHATFSPTILWDNPSARSTPIL